MSALPTCRAAGCGYVLKSDRALLCPDHWHFLPPALRRAAWRLWPEAESMRTQGTTHQPYVALVGAVLLSLGYIQEEEMG
jgi:hypothetical protein